MAAAVAAPAATDLVWLGGCGKSLDVSDSNVFGSVLNSLRFFNRVSLFLIFMNFLGATPDTGGVGHCKQTETMLTAGLSNVVLLVVALCTRAFFRGHTGDRISDLRWSPTIISCRLNSARGKERKKLDPTSNST